MYFEFFRVTSKANLTRNIFDECDSIEPDKVSAPS